MTISGPATWWHHAMPLDSHARERPPGRDHPRNLVVLRAGDASLHGEWSNSEGRDFDVFISYYGANDDRHRCDADYYEMRRGPKWPAIADLLRDHADLVDGYEAVWFPDDDLSVEGGTLNRMFALFHAHRLCLAQPALTRNSFFTWSTLLQRPRSVLRYTHFVEVMAPLFRRDALRRCQPTFDESTSGWGLDWIWPTLCADAGLGRMAVLDATPVRHTRPVGGELYRLNPELTPRADADRLLRKYGLAEVRAEAKYSFDGLVAETALPAWERFLFWIKRINGRRKHLARA